MFAASPVITTAAVVLVEEEEVFTTVRTETGENTLSWNPDSDDENLFNNTGTSSPSAALEFKKNLQRKHY